MLNKKISTIPILLFLAIASHAQFRLGAELGILIPKKHYGYMISNYDFGMNLGISGKYFFNEKIGLGISTGYYHLKGEVRGMEFKQRLIPIQMTVDFTIGTKNVMPYLAAGVGFFIITSESSNLYYPKTTMTEASFTPVAGVRFLFSDKLALDANAKYTFIFSDIYTFQMFNPNIGLIFTL